jgi:hypothetical protein
MVWTMPQSWRVEKVAVLSLPALREHTNKPAVALGMMLSVFETLTADAGER